MNTIKNNLIKNIGIIFISIILISTSIVLAEKTNDNNKDSIKSNFMSNIFNNPYTGTIKIYIAEPVSRWNMYDGEPYHYAFLDFAYNDEISIEYQDTIENTITWNGDVSENNVIVIASIFNSKSYTEYAYPPLTNRFDAFYVDAAAGAKPGQTDYNKVTEEFTHTVFIEEGTATWCHNCPDMANKLNDLYNSEEYPLYFVALVSDENDNANSRLIDDYNVYGYPTAFFDGGKNVIVGSGVSVNTYISKIMNCGQRDVHELNLSLSVEWLGNGNLEITYSITNNENIENFSPEIPTITGPTRAKINENIEYSINCIDPDGDEIYYFIEWGDGDIEEWIGPFESGSSININHIWQEKGDYIIRVKAKDDYNSESDWGTLELKMPKFYQYTSYFDLLKNILQFFLK